MKVIEVIIHPNGQSTIQTAGFQGPACREASRFLEQVLGSTTSEELTADYHLAAPTSQLQHEQGA
jgi:hypothetical protein